jgi:hypothetical protein
MAGLDPAIQLILKDMRFLLLDGPIKSGHDKSEFVGRPVFCSSYQSRFPTLGCAFYSGTIKDGGKRSVFVERTQ